MGRTELSWAMSAQTAALVGRRKLQPLCRERLEVDE